MAETDRTTQAGRNIIADVDNDATLRTTQAGRNIVADVDNDATLRVTQAGRNVFYLSGVEAPHVTLVDSITSGNADVTLSAFVGDGAWASSRYQVQLAGGNWTSLLYDSGWVASNPQKVHYSAPAFSWLEVRGAHKNTSGTESAFGVAYMFQSNDTDPAAVPHVWDDFGLVGQTDQNRYQGTDGGPGGWFICTNRGSAAVNARYPALGKIHTSGRLLYDPTFFVYVKAGGGGKNRGVDVACNLLWSSDHGQVNAANFWGWQYDDCLLAHHGLVALACGTSYVTPTDARWKYPYFGLPGDTDPYMTRTDDFQCIMVTVYPISTGSPFRDACVGGPNGRVKYWGVRLTIYFGGAFQQAWNELNYVHNWEWDHREDSWFAAGDEECKHGGCVTVRDNKLGLDKWRCEPFVESGGGGDRIPQYGEVGAGCYCVEEFPWYGLRLKVWRDYDADSTGKTHRIQTWMCADKALPVDGGETTYKIHDVTWVGGADESTPGAGDGGLYCGWTGFASMRQTGNLEYRTSGIQGYDNLVIAPIEETGCDTPCDYDTPTENNGITILEYDYPSITCPPEVEGAFQDLFFGGKSSPAALYQFGGYEVDETNFIRAIIEPNPVAPEGYGSSCHFKRLVVVVEYHGDISLTVTPVLNGERLDAYTQEETFIGTGDSKTTRRFEVPLSRAYEDLVVEGTDDERFRHGLIGTFFTARIQLIDICGLGVTISGIWIECEQVQERQRTGVVYTEHILKLPVLTTGRGGMFLGTKGGNKLLKGDVGTTDDATAFTATVKSNHVAPVGADEEASFKRASFVVTRFNPNVMEVEVTPIVDDVELPAVTITYQPASMMVTEVTEVPITEYYTRESDTVERFRTHPRGAWFQLKVEVTSGLPEWLTIEGVDLDFEPVQESLRTDIRDA